MEKTKIPMNIQFFAEQAAEPTTAQAVEPTAKSTTEQAAEPTTTQAADKPSNEEMAARIAELEVANKQLEAKNNALQNKNNALSTENKEQKMTIRMSQTAEQREASELNEKLRAALEQNEIYSKQINHANAVAAYKNIQPTKTVETLIEAVAESDHAAIAAIIDEVSAKAIKDARAEWQQSIKQPNFGTGDYSSMTIADAMKIKNREERLKALASISTR